MSSIIDEQLLGLTIWFCFGICSGVLLLFWHLLKKVLHIKIGFSQLFDFLIFSIIGVLFLSISWKYFAWEFGLYFILCSIVGMTIVFGIYKGIKRIIDIQSRKKAKRNNK